MSEGVCLFDLFNLAFYKEPDVALGRVLVVKIELITL